MNIILILLGVTCTFAVVNTKENSKHCNQDVTRNFYENFYKFCTKMFRTTALNYSDHFVNSGYNLWLTLAAIAEGVTGTAQQEVFKTLYLPEEFCQRQKYYKLALELEPSGSIVSFLRKRFLVLDENVKINKTWEHEVTSGGMINTLKLPFKNDPGLAIRKLQELFSSKFVTSDIADNSLIIDTLDYEGLWTFAFPNSGIENNKPFYNDAGEEIAKIDFLTSYRKAKITYAPHLKAKILILPVGRNFSHLLIIAIAEPQTPIRRLVETFVDADLSYALENYGREVYVKISVPRYTLTTIVNMRAILEDVGIKSLWEDENATKLISTPAAHPLAYIHSSTMKLDRFGVEEERPGVNTSGAQEVHVKLEDSFDANKPFIFGLIDSKTSSSHFYGVFSKPT